MATQTEELRLSVTLDDQASAQLGRLQAALNHVGSEVQRIGDIKLDLRGISPGELGREIGFFAGVAEGVTEELIKMGREFLKEATNLSGYSRRMEELGVSAKRATQSIAQFHLNLKDFQRAGVPLESAHRQMQAFADVIGNLQREHSDIADRLLTGLRGNDFENMVRFVQTLRTSDRQTALREAKHMAEQMQDYWTRQGQAERGALAVKNFLNILGVPDLDALDRAIRSTSKEMTAIMKDREHDAKAYNDAVKQTSENIDDIKNTIGATVLLIPGVQPAMDAMAGFSKTIAIGIVQLEKSMRNLNTPEDIAESERQRKGVETPGEKGPGTEQERGVTGQEGMTPEQIERLQRRFRRGGGTATPQQFMGGGAGSDIMGSGTMMGLGLGGAVDRLPEEYEAIGWRSIEDRRGELAGSRPGAAAGDDPTVDNSTQLEEFANELRRLNDFLAPYNTMNPAFHNAPMGGAKGESNPIKHPPAGHPGGGAAFEARPGPRGRPAPESWGPYNPIAKDPSLPSNDPSQRAAVRYNNPGAAWPSADAANYGSIGYGGPLDKEGNFIARFSDPTLGTAANMALYERRYVGRTIGDAMKQWSGQHRAGTQGYDPKTVITKEMLQDPEFAVPYFAAMSRDEATKSGVSEEQLRRGHDIYRSGGLTPWATQQIGAMTAETTAAGSRMALDPELSGGGGGGVVAGMDVEFNPFRAGGGSFGGSGASANFDRQAQINQINQINLMDSSPSSRVNVDTSGMFRVNVDAPDGTSVKAEGDGLLGKTELNRSMPMSEDEARP